VLVVSSGDRSLNSVNTIEALPPGSTDARRADAETLRARSLRRGPMIGLIGVVVTYLAIGTLFALQQTPFVGADEKAHLAYAHVVAGESLPTIDQRQPVPQWATQWLSETIYTHEDENRSVWVANHPPLPYVTVVPLIDYAEATERDDGGLLLMRMANIAWGGVGIVITFFIARELTRSDRLALLSAAAAAMVTQLYASLSLAMTDGMTFAAGAAVTWAGIRCLQRGVTTRNLAILSGLTVVASGVRAVTMMVAGMVVLTVVAFEYLDRRRSGDGWRAARRVAFIGLAPAALAWGWFYIRNIVLYGDIGASSYLLERFDREPNGSLLATLNDNGLWRALYTRAMSAQTYAGARPPLMMLVAALVVGGLVGVLLTRRTGDRDEQGQRLPIARRSIVLLLIGVGVMVIYVAQHISGGGYLHPRYAFPVLGSVATLFVLGLDRIWPKVLPTAVVVGMATWTISQIPVDIDPSDASRPRDAGRLAPAALRVLPGNDVWRFLAGCGVVVGCLLALTGLVIVLRTGSSPTSDREDRSGLTDATPRPRWQSRIGSPAATWTVFKKRPASTRSTTPTA
jgi:hypothetical protein